MTAIMSRLASSMRSQMGRSTFAPGLTSSSPAAALACLQCAEIPYRHDFLNGLLICRMATVFTAVCLDVLSASRLMSISPSQVQAFLYLLTWGCSSRQVLMEPALVLAQQHEILSQSSKDVSEHGGLQLSPSPEEGSSARPMPFAPH